MTARRPEQLHSHGMLRFPQLHAPIRRRYRLSIKGSIRNRNHTHSKNPTLRKDNTPRRGNILHNRGNTHRRGNILHNRGSILPRIRRVVNNTRPFIGSPSLNIVRQQDRSQFPAVL